MADDLKKAFEKEVRAAAGHRFVVDTFADMVRAMAICFEAPLALGERHEELEKEYDAKTEAAAAAAAAE